MNMIFINSGYVPQQYNTLGNGLITRSVLKPPTKVSLNAPMIDRIHKAKPGCSACGKKVA